MPTNTSVVELSMFDVGLAAFFVLVAGIVSIGLRLGLEKRLFIAACRTILQLIIIGYILKWVFAADHLIIIMGIVLVMVGTASHEAIRRAQRTIRGVQWQSFVTLTLSSLLTCFLVTRCIINVEPWFRPQYFIPLLGMILGNGLTGISLCLDHLLESLAVRKDEVEMKLSLGATRWEAAREPIADAVRRGMIPIINSMMVVGVVSLPGMMTGQILAGSDPLQAVRYQIVVMFMIAAATSIACILLALFVFQRLFNNKHQLLADYIEKRG